MQSQKHSERAWTAVALTAALHVLLAFAAAWIPDRAVDGASAELVDIELAPPPPPVEALPEEIAAAQDEAAAAAAESAALAAAAGEPMPAGSVPRSDDALAVDAGIDAMPDAPIDAPPDAPIDARPDARPRPDAAIDAGVDAPADAGIDAVPDAGIAPDPDAAPDAALNVASAADGGSDAPSDATAIASAAADAGIDAPSDATAVASAADGGIDVPNDAGAIAAATDAGVHNGSVATTGANGDSVTTTDGGVRSGDPGAPGSTEPGMGVITGTGTTNEPAVDGAPTTAGTAANLLSYFPKGHLISALIRFDRLRNTEWSAQTERLLQPLPDYQVLFGSRAAGIAATLDTLVISTPSPRDATATTLVAHTHLGRPALRAFLANASPITWSAAKGGMLGTRTGRKFPGDKRVILSPFRGWFLLAQPGDLGGLTAAGAGELDTIEASGKLPPWIAGIRKIEAESGGDQRGPSLVVTVGLDGKRYDLSGGKDFGLGVEAITTPTRLSLAMELVKQGWLVRGNMRFASAAAATEFVTAAEAVKARVAHSTMHQRILGKAGVRVLANLSFSRKGARVSYATSISIADARLLLALTANQLDAAFAPAAPSP